MQPLSLVNRKAAVIWGSHTTMLRRPTLAAKVAQVVARWAEIEISLGAFVALLLHANEKAIVAIYTALENRSAQVRLLNAAAQAALPAAHFDTISVLMNAVIKPAMKDRDKLAHWTWGYSDDLPDALLIANVAQTLESRMESLRIQFGKQIIPDVLTDFSRIFVVRDPDLEGMLKRGMAALENLRIAMGTVWEANSPQERAEHLQTLSNVPRIREGLIRLYEARQKNQAAQQPSPRQEPSE